MGKDNLLIRMGKALDALKGSPMLVPESTGNVVSSMLVNLDGDGKVVLDLTNTNDIKKALDECPPVNFIIGKIAKAITETEISVVSNKDQKPVVNSEGLDFLNKIERPNDIQNRNQFLTQIVYNIIPFGYSLQLKNKGLFAGESSGTWVLPSELVDIEWVNKVNYTALYKSDIMDLVKSIRFDGENINKEDVFFITAANNFRKSIVIPEGQLASAKVTIENLITNFKGRGRLMDSPAFIVSDSGGNNNPQALGLKTDDKREIERKLSDNYGLSGGKSKVIVSRSSVNMQHISFPMSSMQFDIMEKQDVIQLAECLDYPPELLGIYGNANVSERESAERSLYRRTVMPHTANILQQLQIAFEMPNTWHYHGSFDHVEALQVDQKRESEIFKNYVTSVKMAVRSNLMTYGAAQKLLSVEIDERNADKYYYQLPTEIKEGFDSQINNQQNLDSGTGN